jgi:acyl carrier protein
MMTKEQIVEAIFKVLSESMTLPNMDKFHSDARLLEDLALDSSMVLHMLMLLEVEHDMVMDESALMNEDFETVRAVADTLYKGQNLPAHEKGLEVYEDVKIHCVASNLAEIVKRFPQLDHRILYFAVSDANACIDDRFVLTYHDENINHDIFFNWYERLYGMPIRSWYDKQASKETNLTTLESLVKNREQGQHILVMLDMFHLPERENEFNKNPFPHYVMLGPTNNPDLWFMYDPDYRWEGVFNKDRILNAVAQPTVSGGYAFSEQGARPTPAEEVDAFFEASVVQDANPVTDMIRTIISAHIKGEDKNGEPLPLENLIKAVEEIPVMSPRKYAYEHGFAFFWRELGLPEAEFDDWCDVIDELAKTYKLIQFNAMKFSVTKNEAFAEKLFQLLDQQDEREFKLKRRLIEVKNSWAETMLNPTDTQQLEGAHP